MITKLLEEVEGMVDREMNRAIKQHGLFNSDHEGYAVMKEEVEELGQAVTSLQTYHFMLWTAVKDDDVQEAKEIVRYIRSRAQDAIAEAAQVAAMAQKFEESAVGAPEATYRVGDRYIYAQWGVDNIDYTVYDADTMKSLDGGQIDASYRGLGQAVLDICESHDIAVEEFTRMDEVFIERLEAMNNV